MINPNLNDIEQMLRGELSRLRSKIVQCCRTDVNKKHCESYGCGTLLRIEENLSDILVAFLDIKDQIDKETVEAIKKQIPIPDVYSERL
jgi:hypothetical protein